MLGTSDTAEGGPVTGIFIPAGLGDPDGTWAAVFSRGAFNVAIVPMIHGGSVCMLGVLPAL